MKRIFSFVLTLFVAAMSSTGGAQPCPAAAASLQNSSTAERIQRVENGLLPGLLIKGRSNAMKLSDRMAFFKAPGVSIAVINNGAIEWAKGYGVVEAGGTQPITTETLFQAGSISKPVAAMGALRLVEQGKLDLDGDVNQKLVTWKVPENEFTKEKKVTLRGLVSHSAGMTVHGFPGYAADKQVPTVVQVLDGVKPQANTGPIRVDVVPGSKWRYSGGGYTVMQLMMADVYGKPFPQLMRELVLEPIGMKNSTYEQPLPKSLDPKAATAHRNGVKINGRYHAYPEMAAAGLWTTPTDLALWLIEVQKAVAGKSTKLLSSKMATQMVTRQMGDSGLGPGLDSSGQTARFGHGGVDEGFEASMVAYVHSGQGAVVMVNGNRGVALAQEIIRGVAKEYGWPEFLPKELELASVDQKILEQYAGQYDFEGNILTISFENGRLFGQPTGQSKEELFPESETRFIVGAGRFVATFVRDPNGQVTEMILKQGAGERRGKRVK
jgi:CubicO group peptidase (beta-lactamase class C family)